MSKRIIKKKVETNIPEVKFSNSLYRGKTMFNSRVLRQMQGGEKVEWQE